MTAAPQRQPRVTMFVYNNMVHDARVRKEARTLTEAGYDVTVLAVLDPGVTPREESVRGFRILRMSRSILGISRREIATRMAQRGGSRASPGTPKSASRRQTARRPRAVSALEAIVKSLLFPLRRVLVFLRFVRAALRTGADAYHAHDLNTLLVAWTASRLRRKPLIYDTHEIATDRADMTFRWWAALLERALIGRADRVICTNQTRADFTEKLYNTPPPVILRNLPAYVEPQPSTLMHERLGLPADAKIVLYQGGMQPERGLEQLMEAAPEIQGGVIVFLGSGRSKPRLMARAAELGLEGKVYFHEAVPVEELPSLTACAYVGLQLLQNTCFNHYSSLSNKLLEYMMAGVPVIANDLPEMRRVIEDTGAGVIIDASDPHAITGAVNKLLADPALREQMSRQAAANRGRYCWETEERKLVALYAGLGFGPAPPAAAGGRSGETEERAGRSHAGGDAIR
jgi:glycosyltransferase involved in cell wall biosynthesis